MKLGYTEFSFGYAFTDNLIRSVASAPSGAPVFPNLIQEAQLGYDVRINFPACPLFFQYKLPELMVRNSAAEISQHALDGIRIPFFRMPLMRRGLSDQHKLLIQLEQQFPGAVYYASPGMENSSRFNKAYNAAEVHERSVFFSPQNIGPLPDDKEHVIAYRDGLAHAWLCSNPRQIPSSRFGDIDGKARSLFHDPRFSTLREAATLIREKTLELVSPEVRSAENAIRGRIRTRRGTASLPEIDPETQEVAENLLISREIVRVGLGMDMVIAQPR